MTKDQVLGIVRHLLTAVGGWVIIKPFFTGDVG